MKSLLSAIQFLTVIPVGRPATFDPKGMIRFFPVAGIFIGILLALFDTIVCRLWSPPVSAILDVVFIAAITGAFHLDGLGDAADGLYGHRSKEKALEIMKDSRIGVMGLVAIICGLAVKWGGIMGINENRFLFLIIIPAYARSAMLFGFRFLEYGRGESGTGSAFFKDKPEARDFIWMLIPVVLSLFAGWKFLVLNFCFIAVTAGILFFYKKRIGCITGDMLGAMAEITEALLFLVVSANFIW